MFILLTICGITITAFFISRHRSDVTDEGSLEFEEALVHVRLAVVLKLLIEGRVLRVQQHRHPLVTVKIVFGLLKGKNGSIIIYQPMKFYYKLRNMLVVFEFA